MKKLIIVILCCFSAFLTHAQVVSLSTKEVEKLKRIIKTDNSAKKHWLGLLKTADNALSEAPNPVDTILTQGLLQGDPRKTRTREALNDMQKVYALALAYRINDDEKYLTKAGDFLLAWAKRNQPQGDPINDTNLDRIIFAYDLLKNSLPTEVKQQTEKWLENVAQQELNTYERAVQRKKGTAANNWHSHRIKEVALCAWAIDNENLKQWVIDKYKMQIALNLRPDGSSFDFHERDALHYHIYDVDPLMVAATILNRAKVDYNAYTYTSPEGCSLKKSVDWLVPYFTGAQTHAEFVNSKVAFDKKRAENGEKGYIAGTLFNPKEARSSIALADFFDADMLQIYQKQTNGTAKFPTWQFVLNEVKR